MQHTLILPPVAAPALDGGPAFSVIIAYEDLETGKHAKRTYDFLVETLGGDCDFVNQMWKFDVLSIPNLREIAVEDAAKADIIIISSHGHELPGQVTEWIEAWVERALNPLALVALFDRAGEEPRMGASVRRYLEAIAKRGGMEFFAQPDGRTKSRSSGLRRAVLNAGDAGGRTLSTLAGALQKVPGFSRWTNNE
jgi:hypothetical protein